MNQKQFMESGELSITRLRCNIQQKRRQKGISSPSIPLIERQKYSFPLCLFSPTLNRPLFIVPNNIFRSTEILRVLSEHPPPLPPRNNSPHLPSPSRSLLSPNPSFPPLTPPSTFPNPVDLCTSCCGSGCLAGWSSPEVSGAVETDDCESSAGEAFLPALTLLGGMLGGGAGAL